MFNGSIKRKTILCSPLMTLLLGSLVAPAQVFGEGSAENKSHSEHKATHHANEEAQTCEIDSLTCRLSSYYEHGITDGDEKKVKREVEETEYWLFTKARALCRQTEEIRTLLESMDVQTVEVAIKDDGNKLSVQAEDAAELQKIKDLVGFDPCARRLYDDYRSYDPWGFQISAGYEYVSIDNLFDEGEPLIDLLIFRNFRSPSTWRWHPQLFIHGLLTNAAETQAILFPEEMENPMMPPGETTDGGSTDSGGDDGSMMGMTGEEEPMPGEDAAEDLEQALQFDVGLFFPFQRFGDHRLENDSKGGNSHFKVKKGEELREELGFFVEGGFLAVDSVADVKSRYYGGLRLAFNPEWYFDALIGRTEGLDSDRFEIRGQFPIAQTSENSRIYLGIIANLGLDEPEDSPEADVVRIHVKWNVNLSKFFKGLSKGS